MATQAFEEIAETFDFLDDWEERYRHVIELGKAMPALDDAVKVPATKVEGCASQVWILPEIAGQGPSATFRFRGDSDAMIVRGLIAVEEVDGFPEDVRVGFVEGTGLPLVNEIVGAVGIPMGPLMGSDVVGGHL